MSSSLYENVPVTALNVISQYLNGFVNITDSNKNNHSIITVITPRLPYYNYYLIVESIDKQNMNIFIMLYHCFSVLVLGNLII